MVPFGLDEGPDPDDGVHVVLLDHLEELDHVVPALEVELQGKGSRAAHEWKKKQIDVGNAYIHMWRWMNYHSLLGLVDVPEDVALDGVEAALLGLGDEVGPHVRRAPRVVDGPGEEDLPAAVDHERAAVVGDHGALLGEPPRRRGAGRHERERESGRHGGGERPGAEAG